MNKENDMLIFGCLVFSCVYGTIAFIDIFTYNEIRKYTKELQNRAMSNYSGVYSSINSDMLSDRRSKPSSSGPKKFHGSRGRSAEKSSEFGGSMPNDSELMNVNSNV